MKMFILKQLIILIFLSSFQNSFACGWFHTIDMHGKNHSKSEIDAHLYAHRSFDKKWVLERMKEIETSLSKSYNHEEHSDYAMLLSRIGKVKEALHILEKLNEQYPQEYMLMANLGTLYELNGKNKEALFWIKKAVKKNPKSHQESEWIHVKILEAKLKIEENPNWLRNNHIIDISQNQETKNITELEQHLIYQLNERIPYTPNPDPIVFQLLMDLAKVSMQVDLYNTHKAYHFAFIFTPNPKEQENINKQIEKVEASLEKYDKKLPQSEAYQIEGNILEIPDYKVINFFPKEVEPEVAKDLAEQSMVSRTNMLYILSILAFFSILIVIFIIFRKKKK